MERSFVMIKPDGVRRGLADEIIKRLTDAGLEITIREARQTDRDLAYQHYADSDEWYFNTGSKTVSKLGDQVMDIFGTTEPIGIAKQIREWLATYLVAGHVVAMIVSGPEGTIQKIRDLAGNTGPEFADKGTIRGDMGADTYLKANLEKRAIENLIHASESVAEAEREIKLWFPELESNE